VRLTEIGNGLGHVGDTGQEPVKPPTDGGLTAAAWRASRIRVASEGCETLCALLPGSDLIFVGNNRRIV
jgi:hypothetical protein